MNALHLASGFRLHYDFGEALQRGINLAFGALRLLEVSPYTF